MQRVVTHLLALPIVMGRSRRMLCGLPGDPATATDIPPAAKEVGPHRNLVATGAPTEPVRIPANALRSCDHSETTVSLAYLLVGGSPCFPIRPLRVLAPQTSTGDLTTRVQVSTCDATFIATVTATEPVTLRLSFA